MPFLTALSSPDYVQLRGNYAAEQYISLCPNTVVFAARINQASFAASFAQVTYDTVTVGAYTDVEAGMTVYLSRTNDLRAAYFTGRVRANNSGTVATATSLNINETSVDVDDNDYLFVTADWRIWEKLARPSGATQLKDYELTFSRLKPVVYNLQSAYVLYAGSSQGLSQRFQPSAFAVTSGASISSYAFTITVGMTVTAGSASSNDVTIAFAPGWYWLKLIVTDSLGLTRTRRIAVAAVPQDFSQQVALGFTGAQVTGDLDSGWNAAVEGFEGIDELPDGALAIIWEREWFNGAEKSTPTVRFIGRLRRESDETSADETYSQLERTSYELEGAGAQLARTTAPLLALVQKATAAAWDEIVNCTPWRAIGHLLSEHSTFLDLHSLSFDDTGNTFVATGFVTQGDDLLSAVNDLASSINAAVEFAPEGDARIGRSARYLSASERDALTTIAAFDNQDYGAFQLALEYVDLVGRIEASGGAYNTINGKVTPLLAIAPGVAQASGADKSDLHRQILTANASKATAQAELNERAAHRYAETNVRAEFTIDHPDNYTRLIPSRLTWYTWTITASENTAGRAFTTADRWLLESIEIVHDNETGTKTVSAVYRLETSAALAGVSGQTVTYPPVTSIPAAIPALPPISPFPSFPDPPEVYLPPDPAAGDLPPFYQGDDFPTDGNAVVIHTASAYYFTREFIAQNAPQWIDVTPSGTLLAADFKPYGRGGYVSQISPDGSLTRPAYTSFMGDAWTIGTLLPGAYSAVRTPDTVGQLYLYSPNTSGGDTQIISDPLTSSLGLLTHLISPSYPFGIFGTTGNAGTYSSTGGRTGGGRILGQATGYIPDGTERTEASVAIDLGAECTILNVIFWFRSQTEYLASAAFGVHINFFNNAGVKLTGQGQNFTRTAVTSWLEENFTTSVSGVRYIQVGATSGIGVGDLPSIDDISITYQDASGLARTVFSNDYGATFGNAQVVGLSPGAFGGVDTIKVGSLILAGAHGSVMLALNGGVYTSYGLIMPGGGSLTPNAIHIPRRQFGGTLDNVNTITPHYLLASATLVNGSQSVFKVTNGGSLYGDITPLVGGKAGLAVSPDCIHMPHWSGAHVAAVLSFDGIRHLVTTNDTGATWVDRGTLNANASVVRYRARNTAMNQLYLTDGLPAYSMDAGGSLTHKLIPETNPATGIEVF